MHWVIEILSSDNVELKNHELTRQGFLELNQMEADDNQGDTDDLWVTLTCMGYNKGLVMDEVGSRDWKEGMMLVAQRKTLMQYLHGKHTGDTAVLH